MKLSKNMLVMSLIVQYELYGNHCENKEDLVNWYYSINAKNSKILTYAKLFGYPVTEILLREKAVEISDNMFDECLLFVKETMLQKQITNIPYKYQDKLNNKKDIINDK